MKKIFASLAAVALAVTIAGTALAQGGGGCANCNKGQGAKITLPSDQFQKFQQDTLDIRQEMMNKRFELQRENLKGTPDEAKIASIKNDVKQLQIKISAVRAQYGLPEKGKKDGECFSITGECGAAGMGGCNKPAAMGGCNGPCGQQN